MPMNTLTGFVDTCCLVAENAKYSALEMYLTYVNWCINEGTEVHDQFSFLEMLEDQGYEYHQKKGGSFFRGITVLPNYRVE
jgi:phage/plasmid-associated DNA primase